MNIPWNNKEKEKYMREDGLRGMRLSFSLPKLSFSQNIFLILALWPLLWIIGVEQFVPPLIILWEFLRLLYQRRGRIAFNLPSLFAILLAAWSLVPIGWVEPSRLQSFLKESVTLWSQALILLLFFHHIQDKRQWSQIEKGLVLFSSYQVIGSLIYLSGLWRKPITTLIGLVLPKSWLASSVFLRQISVRELGSPIPETPYFSLRVSGLSLHPTTLATICLVLIPFLFYALRKSVIIKTLLLPSIILVLVFTVTRLAYIGFLAGILLFVVLYFFRLHEGRKRYLFLALFFLGISLLTVGLLAIINGGHIFLVDMFTEFRPSSLRFRLDMLTQTVQMLWGHPIAGWGYVERIEVPGVLKVTAPVGTHLGYLNILFRHGIVGLFLYLGIWGSMWLIVIRRLGTRLPKERLLFWALMAAAFLAFNIRELGESWWWDQATTLSVWCIWGLAITAPRVFARNSERSNLSDSGG
jgi:O-antigen ligase